MSEKYEAPEDQWPRKESSSSTSATLYSVEARMAYSTPKQVCGELLDTRWKALRFEPAAFGVPIAPNYLQREAASSGLLGYEAAMALMWWFRANAATTSDDLCLETRLVAHSLKTQSTCTAVGALKAVGGLRPKPVEAPQRPADVEVGGGFDVINGTVQS